MKFKPLLCLLLAGTFASHASAEETRYQHDRAGNIVGIVVGPDAARAETVVVDPVGAKVGERVRLHTEAGAQITAVQFGGATQTPVVTDAKGVEVLVPSGAASGSVALLAGSEVIRQSQDFAVLPAEIASANVAGLRRAELTAQMDVGLIGGRWSLFAADAAEVRASSLQLVSLDQPAAAPIDYRWLSPQGVVLLSGTTTMTTQTTHLPVPHEPGVHVLALRAPRWARLRVRLAADAVIVPDGSPVVAGATQPAPSVRLAFDATAGEDFGLGFDATSTNTSAKRIVIEVRKPDGAVWKSAKCGDGSVQNQCGEVLRDVPSTGTYTVLLRPESTAVTQFSARVWLSRELVQPIVVGAPLPLSFTRPGQIASLTFAGSAGERYQLAQTDPVTVPSSANFEWTPFGPNGACLLASPCNPWRVSSAAFFEFPVLAQTGEHVIRMRFWNSGTSSGAGSTTLTLTRDIPGTLVLDGNHTQADAPAYGQRHRLTFDAVAGDDVSIGLSHYVTTPSNTGIITELYRPNGTLYRTSSCGYDTSNDCGEGLRNLPDTGTYTFVMRPAERATLTWSARVWLSREVVLPIALNTPVALSLPRPGQLATLTFDGALGQWLVFAVKDVVVAGGAQFEFVPRSPAGTCLIEADCSPWRKNAADLAPFAWLTEAGTYSVPIRFWNNGYHSGTGSATIVLSEDVVSTGAVDGNASQVTGSLYGQRHRVTFNGTAGESWGLGLSSPTSTPAGAGFFVEVFRPNGAKWKTAKCDTSSIDYWCVAVMRNLPDSGDYQVVVTPDKAATAYSGGIYVSRELQLSLPLSTPTVLSLPRPGQIAALTFEGTAAQRLRLSASAFATTPANTNFEFVPLRPTAGCLISADCMPWKAYNPKHVDLPALLESGTHRIRVELAKSKKAAPTGSVTINLAPTP